MQERDIMIVRDEEPRYAPPNAPATGQHYHPLGRALAHAIASLVTILILLASAAGSTSIDRFVWSVLFMLANLSQLVLLTLALTKSPKAIDESWQVFSASVLSTVSPMIVSICGALLPIAARNPVLANIGSGMTLLVMPFYLTALWSLGQRLTVLPEAHTLQTHGIYSISRHPLYATYLYWYAIQNLVFQSWLVLGLSAAQAFLTIYRARKEEDLLEKNFAGYCAYKRTVGWIGRRDLFGSWKTLLGADRPDISHPT